MIKDISERPRAETIEIDLTGPDGNAYALMDIARNLYNKLGESYFIVDTKAGDKRLKSFKEIQNEMMDGDYENLLNVMESHFGDFITMYR